MSDFLFGVPTWLVVLGVLVTCLAAVSGFLLYSLTMLRDEPEPERFTRTDRAALRMHDLNHRDTLDVREFRAWNADDDLPA